MSNLTEKCRVCGEQHTISFDNIINAGGHPELKEKVSSGEYFTWECPHCGAKNIIGGVPCLYHDSSEHLMVVLAGGVLKIDDVPEGYTCRIVDSVGELIEKVKIFNAGLDDAVMELCKYITCQELKKDVVLKFVKMDGADGEITFGSMSMKTAPESFPAIRTCRHRQSRKSASTAFGYHSISRNFASHHITLKQWKRPGDGLAARTKSRLKCCVR